MKNFIRLLSEMNSQRYSRLINELISKKIPCGFFCGFDAAQWKVNNALGLKGSGMNIQCICVIDEAHRSNLKANDIPLFTLKEFAALAPKPQQMLYIASSYETAFDDYFRRFGIETMELKNPNEMNAQCEGIYGHLEEIFDVYQMFEDEESKSTYRACLKARVTNRIGDYRFAPEPQYWLEPFTPIEGDVAIDGGAFDGATARDFASRGAKVYSFEMDRKNYERCLPRAEEFNFTLENMGLGSDELDSSYVSADTASRMIANGETGLTAHIIDLDTYVARKKLPRIDYIKLDIEGAELDCLKGAAKSIVRWKPKLAISAYHKPEDIWTLAPFIRSLRPDYRFAFRHYRIDCRDYLLNEAKKIFCARHGLSLFIPTPCEMVLYCK